MDNSIKKTADVIAEEWCQAIELLVQQNLKNLPYDQTVVCTIVDDSQKDKNIYRVLNGDTKFDAYAEDDTYYRINDQVRVSILNGDFSGKKFIVGKYTTAAGEATPYVFPSETILTVDEPINISQLPQAIPGEQLETLIWEQNDILGKYSNKEIYNALLLQFSVVTQGGNSPYGLRVQVTTAAGEEIILYFKHFEFLGNPFAFYLAANQQKAFNLADYGDISKFQIYLYREGLDVNPEVVLKTVAFGTALITQQNKTFKIYTQDGEVYRLSDQEEALKRALGMEWINKTDVNEYIGFSDGIASDYDEIKYLELKQYNDTLLALKTDGMPKSFGGLNAYNEYQKALKLYPEVQKAVASLKGYVNNLRFSDLAKLLEMRKIDLTDTWNNLISLEENLEEHNQQTATIVNNLMLAIVNREQDPEQVWNSNSTDLTDPCSTYLKFWGSIFSTIIPTVEQDAHLEFWGAEVQEDLNNHPEYKAAYNTARDALTKHKETIDKAFTEFITPLDSIVQAINTYSAEPIDLDVIKEYEAIDIADYANRYSIYWYKYQEGYKDEEERFLPNDWVRLTEFDNLGIPPAQATAAADGNYYLQTSRVQPSVEVYVDNSAQKTIYKAVLIYNHEIYISNELSFYNLDSLELIELEDKTKALQIKHGNYSNDVYSLYGEDGALLNPYEGKRIRQVEVSYSGSLGGNEYLDDADIYWYIPATNSMLIFNNLDQFEALTSDELGYECYKVLEERKLEYKIAEIYNANLLNNTIKCKAIKNGLVFEAEKQFTFSAYGTSGTEFTLVVQPSTKQVATTPDQALPLQATLFNKNHEQVSLENINITIKGISGDLKDTNIVATYDNEKYHFTIPANLYGIIEVKLYGIKIGEGEQSRYIDLTTYYSVPWAKDSTYRLNGTTTVIYNSLGTNPKYFKDEYYLYDGDNKVEAWPQLSNNKAGILSFQKYNDDARFLIPSPIYIANAEYPCLFFEQKGNLWKQDIYIAKNQYGVPTSVNDWDGKLQVNKDGDDILSAMMGAGTKDTNNRFTGVLMGDVNGDVGLYGYDKGEQSFGFKSTDGSAFIGKNTATGKIEFNPTSEGGKLTINARDFTLNAASGVTGIESGLFLSSSPPAGTGANYYFFVGDKNKNGYLSLDSNYNFTLSVNQLILTAGKEGDDDYFYLSNYKAENGNKLIIGKNFQVTENGSITANSGIIGGITLSENGLSTADFPDNAVQLQKSYRATMAWRKGTKWVDVKNYDVPDSNIWENIPYLISKDVKEVYLTGWGRSTEFFIMETCPAANGEYEIIQHKYATDEPTDVCQILYNGTKNWYIIINKKPTITALPTLSPSPSSFSINKSGMIKASNAQISGNIKATSVTAVQKSEIVGWAFEENKLTGSQELYLNTPKGMISLRYDTKLNEPVLEIHNGGDTNDYKKIKLLDLG